MAERTQNDGFVFFLADIPVLLLGVIDFQKEHPGNLLDALHIAVDAGVVAHDVPDAFDKA